MSEKAIMRKMAAFLIGGALVFFVLEIILRAGGFFIFHRQGIDKYKQVQSGYRILCIGDSFTYGLGAAHDLDYPTQLARMLGSRYPEGKFQVMNRGRCSYNTTQIISDFQAALREGTAPDLVILLGGGNNYWNFYGRERQSGMTALPVKWFFRDKVGKFTALISWKIRKRGGSPVDTFGNIPATYNYGSVGGRTTFLEKVKARFRRGDHGSKAYIELGVALAECGSYPEAEKCFLKGIEIEPSSSEGYARMGGLCVSLGRYEEAKKWLDQSFKTGPGDIECYVETGWFYLQQRFYDEAVEWYRKGLEIDPKSGICYLSIGTAYARQALYDEAVAWLEKGIAVDRMNGDLYRCLAGVYANKGETAKSRECILLAACLDPEDIDTRSDLVRIFGGDRSAISESLAKNSSVLPPKIAALLKKISYFDDVKQWIISDIREIADICRRHKSRMLLMDYPGDESFSELMSKIAGDNSIPFVSNYRVFSVMDRAVSRNCFVSDGHCSADGYAVIARNLLNFLEAEGK